MKKLFAIFALVMGLGTAAFATTVFSTSSIESPVMVSLNDFKPIELEDLPQPVQDALAKDYAELQVKSAAVELNEETGTSTYQVTLIDADGNESTVLFNEKGEVQPAE